MNSVRDPSLSFHKLHSLMNYDCLRVLKQIKGFTHPKPDLDRGLD